MATVATDRTPLDPPGRVSRLQLRCMGSEKLQHLLHGGILFRGTCWENDGCMAVQNSIDTNTQIYATKIT
jgi:hypothetical protein